MPAVMQWVIGIAAFAAAVGIIWRTIVRPAARAITLGEEMMPLLQELTVAFKGTPDVFRILDDVARQFRTNAGSSLRDAVNGLTKAAEVNAASAEVLKHNLGVAKELAAQDRAQLARLLVLLDRLDVKVMAGMAGVDRLEMAEAGVAERLAERQRLADETHGPEGAAADAYSRTSIHDDDAWDGVERRYADRPYTGPDRRHP